MEINSLNISNENLGEMLDFWIRVGVERIMNDFIEQGYTEDEVKEAQDLIESWVINDAEDALEYWFGEGDEVQKKLERKILKQGDFNEIIERHRESMAENSIQQLVPEDKYEMHEYVAVVWQLESEGKPFTKENVDNKVKEMFGL